MEESVIQINGGVMINVNVSVKKVMHVKKIMLGNLLHVVVKMEKKYLASIMDDSAIMCDELTESYNEETKIIPTIFLKKKATCKTQNFCFACILLITIALLTAVNI